MREYIVRDAGYPLLSWLITSYSKALTNGKKSSLYVFIKHTLVFSVQLEGWRMFGKAYNQKFVILIWRCFQILFLCVTFLYNMIVTLERNDTDTTNGADRSENNMSTNDMQSSDPAAALAYQASMEFVNGKVNSNTNNE